MTFTFTLPDFQKWRFFFCDERVVPFDHPESTFGAFRALIPTVPGLNEAFFVTINPQLPLEECERDYALKMKQFFMTRKVPDLDICVLGMGPDGHTCSLFPNHELLLESKKWVASIADSPKPPPQRVTFTLPVLNAAKNVSVDLQSHPIRVIHFTYFTFIPHECEVASQLALSVAGDFHRYR